MNQEILEELEVLRCIYSDDTLEVQSEDDMTSEILFSDESRRLRIKFILKNSYPHETGSLNLTVERDYIRQRDYEASSLELFSSSIGEVALFKIIEELRTAFDTDEPTSDSFDDGQEENDQITSFFPTKPTESDFLSKIIHGPVTIQQKSSFQSHLAPVQSMSEVKLFRETIINDKRFGRATHNIFAYRFTDPKTNICHHDYDDDGETAAASRIAEMMRLMGVDNVAIIVSRWFGGILLGPDRFKFICNSARDLLENNGFADSQKSKSKH